MKGKVKIEADKGWLRIRFSHLGKRHAFTLGMPDNKINRTAAQSTVTRIELDILSGNFDPTLRKYKPEKVVDAYRQDRETVTALYQRWMAHKAKEVSPKTMEKFRATLTYLSQHFDGKPVEFVGEQAAEAFVKWQRTGVKTTQGKNLSLVQVKRRTEELEACWRWANAESNPWESLAARIRIPPKQAPKPFTKSEMKAIIQGFKDSQFYSHYAPYVQFLFATGCRTGEAIGLKWKHLNDDCSVVWIGESLSRGVRKATKTNRARTIDLPLSTVQMLLDLRSPSCDPEATVFTSPTGLAMDDHNFTQRAWKAVLTSAGVEYRKPYITRSTLISHALEQGMNPVTVAQLTGHDVETLYSNYSGSVNSRPRLPELL